MPKLILDDFTNLTNEATFISNLNENFTRIEEAFDNSISRDGSVPNTMEEDLDMGSNRILNLPVALSNNEPVRLREFRGALVAQGFDLTIEEGVQAMLDAYVVPDGSITAIKLASDAVTNSKILNGEVSNSKLASSSVATANVQDDAVTYAKMQNAASKGIVGASAAGNYGHITLGTGLDISGGVLISTSGLLYFETRAGGIAATIDVNTDVIFVSGYTTVGDYGGGMYIRSPSEPSHPGKFQSNGSTVWWSLTTDVCNPHQFGAVGDNVTNDTAALNNAELYPAPVKLMPGKTYLAAGQLSLLQSFGKRWFADNERTNSVINCTYNAGPCILIGNASTTSQWVSFERIGFLQTTSTQPMFRLRKVRGLRMESCRLSEIYKGFEFGTATDAVYIFELFNCEVFMRLSSHSHFIDVVNCSGQIHIKDSFVEGGFLSGTVGLRIASNVQPTCDHIIITGGYFSRFGYNIYFNSRCTNWVVGHGLLQEGWVNANIYGDVDSSWENFLISGLMVNAPAIPSGAASIFRAEVTQTTASLDGPVIVGLRSQSVPGRPAIEIACPATNKLNNFMVVGSNFGNCTDTADNTNAVIELNNANSAFVDGVSARNTDGTKRFAYLFRSQNSGADVKVGSVWIGTQGTGQSSIS